MIFRRAELKDAPELLRLVAEYCHEMMDEYQEPDRMRTFVPAIEIALHSQPVTVIVAEADDMLVGFAAWVYFSTCPIGEAQGLGTYVMPGHRRRQVSARLRECAKRALRELGITRVIGSAVVKNYPGYKSAMESGAKVVGYIFRWDL